MGRDDLELWPPDLARIYKSSDRAVLDSGAPQTVLEEADVDGGRRFFEVYKSPVTIDGQTVGTVGFATDVTERHDQERLAQLAHEGAELENRIARSLQAPDQTFQARLDAALRHLDQLEGALPNPSARLTLADEALGDDCGGGRWRDPPPDTRGRGASCVPRCSRNAPEHGHYFVPLYQGDDRLGVLVIDTVVDPIDAAPRAQALQRIGVLFAQAILNERATQLLRGAAVKAQAASEAKSRFLATMSHELRTPLNGILGMAQLLAAPDTPEQTREPAETILESGHHLLTILNDLLDLARIEAGELTLNPTPLDPRILIRDSVALFEEPARRKGLELQAHWQGPELHVLADATRIQQMLANLISNAIKFTHKGTVTVAGRAIESDRAGRSGLEISVTDTGIGIPAEDLGRLFKRFSQVDDSSTRRFGGAGLGLSIVRDLAQEMRGRVGVQSQLGQGSKFWFRVCLPLAGTLDISSLGLDATPGPEGAVVLVVEDNAINRRVAERMLERLGAEIHSAENGREAIEALQAGLRPDLVLMDCQMPELDGWEATLRIRAWETERGAPAMPIVALTAGAYESEQKRCLEVGMDRVLTKPVKLADLQSALQLIKTREDREP